MKRQEYSPNEALERIKLMMGYDPRKTLTENREILNEQAFPTSPNPGGWATGIAAEIGKSVNGAGTRGKDLIAAIKKIKTAQHFYDVQSLLKANTNGQYDTFTSLVNGEMEFSNFNEVKEISDHFKSIPGIGSKYDSTKAVTNNNGVKGEQNSFKTKSFTVYGIPTDPRLKVAGGGNKKDNKKQDDPTNTKKVVRPIPPELKDDDGTKVKAFQEWLDNHHSDIEEGTGKGWATGFSEGKLKRGSGYGRFGPRTSRAWGLYKQEYLNPSKIDTSTLAAPAVKTYTTADQTKNTPAQETLPMGVSGPTKPVEQPTITTTDTNPIKDKEFKLQ